MPSNYLNKSCHGDAVIVASVRPKAYRIIEKAIGLRTVRNPLKMSPNFLFAAQVLEQPQNFANSNFT